MPIKTLTNQYNGINAHLHSHWQAHGGWNNFHNRHISDIAGLLRHQLIPMGYTATIEESLQIRYSGDTLRVPRSDVLIQDLQPERGFTAVAPVGELTVASMLVEADTEKPYRALAIYKSDNKNKPVAWIELLSPTNKGNHKDASAYVAKRRMIIETGLVFVEIDYLHESPPTFQPLLDYTNLDDKERGAVPYRIVVLDPQPDIESGPAVIIDLEVDLVVPLVNIPLSGNKAVTFDFGTAYKKTFTEMAYGLETVDYTRLPANFDSYSQHDRLRIVRRMVAVMDAHNNGQNLETGTPLPVPELSLEDALARITAAQ